MDGDAKITRTATVGRVLLAYPRLYGPLMELGLCCVSEETVMWTMERLALDTGRDCGEMLEKLNARLETA